MPFDFQAMVRTPECQAALIVYEKYRRKFKLEHRHLLEMHEHACAFSIERMEAGKKCGKDLLTQEVSAFCKSSYANTSTPNEL